MQSPCFEEATKFGPTKVFLQVGDNDINMTTSVAEVVSGIREIVNKVSSIKSVKRIVIGNLFRKIICGNMQNTIQWFVTLTPIFKDFILILIK